MAHTTFKKYTVDKHGNDVYLIQDDKSYYETIVVKIGNSFYNGLLQPLPPDTAKWCEENIR